MIRRLEKMVQPKHEVIVGSAGRRSGLEQVEQTLAEATGPAIGQPIRRADVTAVFLEKVLEGERGRPDVRIGGMQVDKQAKDSGAARWPGREGIDVQQVIARGEPELADCFFF